jgi:hypothetical protein
MIKQKDFDGCGANTCFVVDHTRFIHKEVMIPILFAGIEKAYQFGFSVKKSAQVSAFIAVAVRTTASKIVEGGIAAMFEADDMVYMKTVVRVASW